MTNKQHKSTTNSVTCRSIYGPLLQVPKEKMLFRNSVYGVIIHENKILLVRTRTTNALTFPGGGIELGETMHEALKREVSEETGIKIKVGEMFHAQEEFFYFDPEDVGYHAFLFFFRCQAITTELVQGTLIDDFRTHQPSWIPLNDLDPQIFLEGARNAVSIILKKDV